MITLHKYVAAWGLPDLSPFCIKAETYLRMVGLPFETAVTDSRTTPKKKLPCVDDEGTMVCDSRDIIAHFEAKLPEPLDAGISPADRALSVAYRGLLEEEAYFLALYQRWQLDAGYAVYGPVLGEYARAIGVPSFVASFILRMVRRQLVRDTWGQGTGRHTPEQVDARLCEVIDAVSTQLGHGPYFLGERPRTIDATVYAFMASLLDAPFDTRAREHTKGLTNLAEYCERMHARYYAGDKPEAAEATAPAAAATAASAP